MLKKRTYKILLTNDDGIFSSGLEKLYYEMKKIGKVTVIAPDSERCGTSHCVTVTEDVRVEKYFKIVEFLWNWKKVDFEFAAKIAKKIALKVLTYGLPKGTFLNVNIPPVLNGEIKGVSITR